MNLCHVQSGPFSKFIICTIFLCHPSGCNNSISGFSSDANSDHFSKDSHSDLSLVDVWETPKNEAKETYDAATDKFIFRRPLNTDVPDALPTKPLGAGYPNDQDIFPSKVAYLTFDDGPSEWTHGFLDILKNKNVHATFFVCAFNLKGPQGLEASYIDPTGKTVFFRDIIKRIVEEGHVIGNHTAHHVDLAHKTEAEINQELDLNEQLISQLLPLTPGHPHYLSLIRTPFGSPWRPREPVPSDPDAATLLVSTAIACRGLNMLWTLDSTDSREWALDESYTQVPGKVILSSNPPTYAEKIARIRDSVLSDPLITNNQGAIILMHDTHNATRDALEAVIDGLRNKGYSFATLEEYAHWRWNRSSAELSSNCP